MKDLNAIDTSSQVNQHNYGIDLMRIFAMFLIVYHHVIDHGGTLTAVPYGSLQYYSVTLMNVVAYCGVDCFALISGYVGLNANFSYKRLFRIWAQVVFFNLVFILTSQLYHGIFSLKDAIWLFLPFTQGYYWYISAYAMMFFTIPIMNSAVKNMPFEKMRKCVWSGFVILSLFALLPFFNGLADRLVNKGYKALWLAFMYLVGAFVKEYGFEKIMPDFRIMSSLNRAWQWFSSKITGGSVFNISLFFILGIFAWIPRYMIPPLSTRFLGREILYGRFCIYNSPTMVLTSIAVLYFFLKLNTKYALGRVLGSLTLGVYIVHFNPVFKVHILNHINEWFKISEMNFIVAPLFLALCALIVYIVCSAMDYVRYIIFKKIGI